MKYIHHIIDVFNVFATASVWNRKVDAHEDTREPIRRKRSGKLGYVCSQRGVFGTVSILFCRRSCFISTVFEIFVRK